MRDFPAGDFDRWKTTEPDFSDPRDDETCPHGEDRPDDCEDCNFEPPELGECPHRYTESDRCDLCGLPVECVDIDVSALMPRRSRR